MDALIEYDLRFRLGQRIVIRLELDRSVLPGRGTCRGDPGRACRLADVRENGPDRRCLGHEGNDLHLGAAVRAGEREDLEQTGDEGGPQVPCRGTRQRIRAIGLVYDLIRLLV